MNWTMLAVTLILGFILPATAWAVFACSKDVHQYANHYASGDFSVEPAEAEEDQLVPANVQKRWGSKPTTQPEDFETF